MQSPKHSPIPLEPIGSPHSDRGLSPEDAVKPWGEVTPPMEAGVLLLPVDHHRRGPDADREYSHKLVSDFEETTETYDSEAQDNFPWRKIALKVGMSVIGFLLVCCVLEHVASERITALSRTFMDRIGLPGLFFGVLLFDALPQPFTYVPLIFLAVKGAVPKLVVFAVCMAASYMAALCGYGIGYYLRGPSWGREWFDMLAEKHPYVPELMERRGAVGVLLAAMLPVPLAVATWTAGFFNVDRMSFLVAALGRCPKILVFVLLSPGPALETAAA